MAEWSRTVGTDDSAHYDSGRPFNRKVPGAFAHDVLWSRRSVRLVGIVQRCRRCLGRAL